MYLSNVARDLSTSRLNRPVKTRYFLGFFIISVLVLASIQDITGVV